MTLIRRLTPEDAEAYLAIRMEMLEDSPWAFLGSPEEARREGARLIRKRLANPENAILGIERESGEGLAAVAGVRRMERLKVRHWAAIWGVYTTPRERRRGRSRALMIEAIGLARSWEGVEMIDIAVSANSPGALRLYESLGFVAWGREPRVTRVGDQTYDEIHLALRLESAGGGGPRDQSSSSSTSA